MEAKEMGTVLFPDGMNPTARQSEWGAHFLALYHDTDSLGLGAGKTWFWQRVADFLTNEGEI